jgi:hypothetical protein
MVIETLPLHRKATHAQQYQRVESILTEDNTHHRLRIEGREADDVAVLAILAPDGDVRANHVPVRETKIAAECALLGDPSRCVPLPNAPPLYNGAGNRTDSESIH